MASLIDDVIATAEFHRRTSRLPDYQAENAALVALALALADSSREPLRCLAEIALELCQAGSSGISLLQPCEDGDRFRSVVVAGQCAANLGDTASVDSSLCGVALQRNAAQLFIRPGRRFTAFNEAEPPIVEALVLPLAVAGNRAGTIWILSHDERRKFDGEDLRRLTSLSNVAAAALARPPLAASLRETTRSLERQLRIFDTTLSSIVDFAYIFGKDCRFIYANRALLDLLGITVDEIVGKNFFDLQYPDELAARLQQQIQQVFETSEILVDETPYTSPTGAGGYYEYIFRPVIADDGSVEAVAGSTRDITEHKRVEAALQASEEKSRNILESITEAFFALDQNWRFTYVNGQAERLLELTPGDLLGTLIWDAYPGLVGSEFEQAYRRAAVERVASTLTSYYPDHKRWYEVHVYPAMNGITIYFKDVSEQMQTQGALRESEQRYRTLFETIDQGFCLVEVLFDESHRAVDYRFQETNPAFEKQTGLIKAAGRTASELVPDLDVHWFEIYGNIAVTGESVRFEDYSEPMGRWFNVYAYRVGPPDDRKVAILFTDITERKQAEEALHSSEARLRAVYDGTDQYMGLLSSDGTVLEANRAALEFINGQRHEVVGCLFWETPWWTHTPGAAEQLRQAVERAATGEGFRQEVSLRSPAGETAIFDFSLHPIRNERGEVILIVPEAQDVTHRKHLENERERLSKQVEVERARLQYLFDYAPTFAALLRGPDHIFELVNPIYYQVVGHREVLGRPAREALPEVEGQGFFELLDQVYTTGQPYVGREMSLFLQLEPNGPPVERFFDFIYQAYLEADGSISGIFAHGVDVTEQVTARKAVEEANRLKDEFLATLSHELRNPLNNILGYSELLRRSAEAKQFPLIRQASETIHSNAEAQAQLINDLLDLSRLQTGKLAVERYPLHLAPIIGDAVETVRSQAGEKKIKLNVDLAAEPLTVYADPVRLQQIVWNLANNAVKFTPRGGRVAVRLSREDDQAVLVVEDNGQGIAPEFLPHVFEMFRQGDARTTRKYGGMGIGLALVRQLTELHGGQVEIYSEGLGQGACFTVRLPLHRSLFLDSTTGFSPQSTGALSGARILVVDDTQDSVDMLRLLLTSEGATVETVLSGAEGLSIARYADFDLVISDISMPEMDGYEFLQALRANPRYRDTPAIALTGFGRDEDVERAHQAGFNTHLTKPLDFDNLVKLACATLQR